MRGRNSSAVTFELRPDLTHTLPWIAGWNEAHPGARITLFHVVLAGLVRTLTERPRLNRFVAGNRIYDRHRIEISFSAKKRLEGTPSDEDAPLVTVKRVLSGDLDFASLVRAVHGGVREARGEAATTVDKELAFFFSLPLPLFGWLVRLLQALDAWNLAPAFLLRDDPLYCSAFVANLGSVGLDAGYHHLFEYGNCPIFLVIGRLHDEVALVDGQPGVRPTASLKFTYDERIEDGLYCARALDLFRTLVEDPGWLSAPGGPGSDYPSTSATSSAARS